ncbi:MAG TPA: GerMN domain-containing protein [Acidimicrobiales bacterium]
MRRLRVLLGLLIGAVALSGCTLVSTTTSPQTITPKDVPFCLRCKTIPGTNNGSVHFISQPVYIVDVTGHLAPSSRIVPSPPVLESVLRQLIIGPTKIETGGGYTSALPKNLIILSASFRGGVGYVDLATPLSKLPRSQEILAVGQMVLTARDVGLTLDIGVKGIEITVGGVPQNLPIPGGHEERLVTPADFQNLSNS